MRKPNTPTARMVNGNYISPITLKAEILQKQKQLMENIGQKSYVEIEEIVLEISQKRRELIGFRSQKR